MNDKLVIEDNIKQMWKDGNVDRGFYGFYGISWKDSQHGVTVNINQ
jgi:hypothetical protein